MRKKRYYIKIYLSSLFLSNQYFYRSQTWLQQIKSTKTETKQSKVKTAYTKLLPEGLDMRCMHQNRTLSTFDAEEGQRVTRSFKWSHTKRVPLPT